MAFLKNVYRTAIILGLSEDHSLDLIRLRVDSRSRSPNQASGEARCGQVA